MLLLRNIRRKRPAPSRHEWFRHGGYESSTSMTRRLATLWAPGFPAPGRCFVRLLVLELRDSVPTVYCDEPSPGLREIPRTIEVMNGYGPDGSGKFSASAVDTTTA